jgi:hypothetical protein
MESLFRACGRPDLRAALGVAAFVVTVGATSRGPIGAAPGYAQGIGSYAGQYGDAQTIPLEELLNGNYPRTGAVRTRGTLEAGPRVQGGLRRYNLRVSGDRLAATIASRLPITPSVVIRDSFDFDADRLNMREIEVVGTFQSGMGMDSGTGGGFWFWSYSSADDEGDGSRSGKARPSPTGLLAIEDLVGRPASLAKETVRVRGQFRGKNLFGDLAPAGAPADGWVIKDGDSAVWVSGKQPKGSGWSLDPESKSDTTRWVEVVGKIETRDGVTYLKASQLALAPPPKPGDDEAQ